MPGSFRFTLLVMILAALSPAVPAQTLATFDLPSQPLAETLKAIGSQTHVNLIVSPSLVDGRTAPALKAQITIEEALSRVLAGTGIQHRFLNEKTVVLEPAKPPTTQSRGSANDGPEEVIVTGSRLAHRESEGAQQVKSYTGRQIRESGQTTVAEFLATLTEASVATNENGYQTVVGATSVQLHGLPHGTTLLLINGRRVESSGSQVMSGADFFDLNNLPVSAVARVEVLPEGAAAVYGSDAIAGVVNVILKKGFQGLESNVSFGHAQGMDEWNVDAAWGVEGERGAFSILGNVKTRTPLEGYQRSRTANQDFRRFGGPDARVATCNPGNVYSLTGTNLPGLDAPYAALSMNAAGVPALDSFLAGTQNKCNRADYLPTIPRTDRQSILTQGRLKVLGSTEVFFEVLASHVRQVFGDAPPSLYGSPEYSQYTLGAQNPYNPFGVDVGVSYSFTSLGPAVEPLDTTFVRPLVGVRGRFGGGWDWEAAVWDSEDSERRTFSLLNGHSELIQAALNSSDPATALNPFAAEAAPLDSLRALFGDWKWSYGARAIAASAFARGSAFELPAGTVDVVVGTEYRHDTLRQNIIDLQPYYPPNTKSNFERISYAAFVETRVPILARGTDEGAKSLLAATLAGRYDHYDDFGSETIPQVGLEWRPLEQLLVRGNYSKSFKAPTLYNLYGPQYVGVGNTLFDPQFDHQLVRLTVLSGGNPELQPETGKSKSLGFVYSSVARPDLQVSVNHWDIHLNGSIQALDAQLIVDNEALFPQYVTRDPACAGRPPCPLLVVNSQTINFGATRVTGVDIQVHDAFDTAIGDLALDVGATNTYRYDAALIPGAPATDRAGKANNDGNFAPKWKAAVGLGWQRAAFSGRLTGRYVGKYTDYDGLAAIGDFWLFDANARVAVDELLPRSPAMLRGAYFEVGGVNIFNSLPQFSWFSSGMLGYDPTQGDIRGRFVYARFGLQL